MAVLAAEPSYIHYFNASPFSVSFMSFMLCLAVSYVFSLVIERVNLLTIMRAFRSYIYSYSKNWLNS